MIEHEHPFPGQRVARIKFRKKDGYGHSRADVHYVNDIDEATVITSSVERSTDIHRPVLDFDFPVKVVPSSAPGHFHVYLDHMMAWDKYKALLLALQSAGLLDKAYVDQCVDNRESCVRLPWITKESLEGQ